MSVEKLPFALEGVTMSTIAKFGETCQKTVCGCVVAAVVAVTLLSITAVMLLASNTSVAGMFRVLFPD